MEKATFPENVKTKEDQEQYSIGFTQGLAEGIIKGCNNFFFSILQMNAQNVYLKHLRKEHCELLRKDFTDLVVEEFNKGTIFESHKKYALEHATEIGEIGQKAFIKELIRKEIFTREEAENLFPGCSSMNYKDEIENIFSNYLLTQTS